MPYQELNQECEKLIELWKQMETAKKNLKKAEDALSDYQKANNKRNEISLSDLTQTELLVINKKEAKRYVDTLENNFNIHARNILKLIQEGGGKPLAYTY